MFSKLFGKILCSIFSIGILAASSKNKSPVPKQLRIEFPQFLFFTRTTVSGIEEQCLIDLAISHLKSFSGRRKNRYFTIILTLMTMMMMKQSMNV